MGGYNNFYIDRGDQIAVFTGADETTINYEFTIKDPGTFTRPFSGKMPFKRLPELVHEYACHEGNYALDNILRGARAQERGNN